MKFFFNTQTALACILLLVFSLNSTAAIPPAKPATLEAQLQGTWKLISYNYVGFQQTLPPDKVCLKTISSAHYSWIYYHATSNEIISASGGSYSLTDNIYSEKVDYLQGAGADFRSAAYKTCFTTPDKLEEQYRAEKSMKVGLEGDIMSISGTSVNGYTIEETWQRVK